MSQNKSIQSSRRNFLKGLGIGTLGMSLASFPSMALAQVSATDTTPIFQFALGDWTGYVISDATFQLPFGFFGSNVDPAELQSYFENIGVLQSGGETINVSVLVLVLTNGEDTIMVDAGNGGRLIPALESIGMSADSINSVVVTHWHGDHVRGLSSEGAINFPNATVYFPQLDYDLLQSAPADEFGGAVEALQPYVDAGQIQFFGAEDEVISGVQAIPTHGHTPGHVAFLIGASGSQLIHVGDSVSNPYSAMPNPDWAFNFDADVDMAIEARKAILGQASDMKVPIMGYHFPFPGMGYAVREGDMDSWRFYPTAF